MRRFLPFVVLLVIFAAASVFAQQATLNTPVSRPSEDNLRAETLYISRDLGGRWEVQVSVRDSGGTEIRRVVYNGPDAAHPSATALAIATAYTTARSGEIGVLPRRLDFRLLGFLSDVRNGEPAYLTGVTVVP